MRVPLAGVSMLLLAAIAGAGTLVVVDKSAFRASLFDPVTRRELAWMPTQRGPHEIALSADGRRAYISDFGRHGVYPAGDELHRQPGRTITVLDLARREPLASFDLGDYRGPHGLALSRDDRLLWVTVEQPRGVLELDATVGTVRHFWPSSEAGGHLLVPARDARYLYVSNPAAGSISRFDTTTGGETVTPMGPGTEGIDLGADGRELWVTSREQSLVSIIELKSGDIVARFDSGGQGPARVRMTPDGREAWVLNPGSRSVAIFDVRQRRLLARLRVVDSDSTLGPGNGGPNPTSIVFSADGRRAYIADPTLDEITIVDARRRQVLGRFRPGVEPEGLAWSEN